MPVEEVLFGLKFAKNRWTAKDAGVLKVGRKSIIKKRGTFGYDRASAVAFKKLENDDCKLSKTWL